MRVQRKSGPWPSSNFLRNPFGIQAGGTVVASIEQVMWYRCSMVPTDSTMFRLSTLSQAENLWDEAAFLNAINKFASGGYESCAGQTFPPQLN